MDAHLFTFMGDKMSVWKSSKKTCFCHTCMKAFHAGGINRHRAMHRDRKEDCVITYTNGDTYRHRIISVKERILEK
jgi:hypothetical protein